jgi:hypothetical protein
MVGFRDPNLVAIKEFYEPSAKVNYFALFVQDRSTLVRETFYKTIGDFYDYRTNQITRVGCFHT